MVLRIGDCVANTGDIGRLQPAGYALLVQVGIRGKRKQAGVLVLPAEASAAHFVSCFRHRHLDELARDLPSALRRLIVGDSHQSVAVNGLNKSVPQRVQGGAERTNSFRTGYPLLCLRASGPVIHQRTIRNDDRISVAVLDGDVGIDEVAERIEMSRAQLGDLADSTAHWILMAIHASLVVVHRPQALIEGFLFFERLLGLGKARNAVGGHEPVGTIYRGGA